MNPDLPSNEREEIEARITALLLGELPPEQAASLRTRVEQDPELAALHRRLEHSISMLRSASQPLGQAKSTNPLRLSSQRRTELFREFQKGRQRRTAIFNLSTYFVPLAAAAVLMLVSAMLLVPTLTRSRGSLAMLRQTEPTAPTGAVPEGATRSARRAPSFAPEPVQLGDRALSFGVDKELAARVESETKARSAVIAGAEFINQNEAGLSLGFGKVAGADSSDRVGGILNRASEARGVVRLESQRSGEMPSGGQFSFIPTPATPSEPRIAGPPSAAQPLLAGRAGATLSLEGKDGALVVQEQDFGGYAVRGFGGGGSATMSNGRTPKQSLERFNDTPSAAPAVAFNEPATPAVKPASGAEAAQAHDYYFYRQAVPSLGDTPAAGGLFSKGVSPQSRARGSAATEMFFDLAPAAETEVEQLAKKAERADYDKDAAANLEAAKEKAEDKLGRKVLGSVEELAPTIQEQLPALTQARMKEGRPVTEAMQTNFVDNLFQNAPLPARPRPPLEHQPEVLARENPFSTFSLNVSDVSFKLANASLEGGTLPDPASVRAEEFINAFDYRDPEPAPGSPIAFAWERARHPFAHNRDVLRLSIKTAATGRPEWQALNLTLLLDNSGSMERADRVRIVREALQVLGQQLRAQDRLSIVTFARNASLKADGVPGNEAQQALESAAGLTPEGGTNLEEAMNTAYAAALRNYIPAGQNRVVLLTDGAANLGDVTPENLKKKVEEHRRQGVALDCFGIGWEGYNDDLLETLSRNGDGRYGFVNTPEAASTEFAAQLAGALQVAASDVKVQVEFNPARVVTYRQVGYAKHQLTKEQFRDNTVDAAEIAAAEAGNALYVVELNPSGSGDLGSVRVRYKVPGTAFHHEHEWSVPYTGSAAPLEKASPALRLNATSGFFADWLARNPYAAETDPGSLLALLRGIPETYGADTRPHMLETMIQQARRIAGN